MASLSQPGQQQTLRDGHLLNPNHSLDSNINSVIVEFQGWQKTHLDWCKWATRLQRHHEATWRRAGILEAIQTAALKIHQNKDIILALAQKWHPETSSFIFRWGEASVTLEDVCVLGGFSVTGDRVSVRQDIFPEEGRLLAARRVINKTSVKKCTYSMWLKHFTENKNEFGDIDHEAFLVFWLSKFVFPRVKDAVGKHVHSIAIQLAKGTRIALAPAILAALYVDLGRLKKATSESSTNHSGKKTVDAWSLMHLVQAWVWERFPTLGPIPNRIRAGEPRLSRWHDLKVVKVDDVESVLDAIGEKFQWRPYCKITESSVEGEIDDRDVERFALFIRPGEVVGLEGLKEQYQPQRVAMQFGLDRGITGSVSRFNESPDTARDYFKEGMTESNMEKAQSKTNNKASKKRNKDEDESEDEDPLNDLTTGELLRLAFRETNVVGKGVASKKKCSMSKR